LKRPSFQFYPADWRNNAKLRRCSEASRGAWMDVLCVLHDMDDYGICRWPLVDLARAANINLKLVKELVDKGVLKGADKDAQPYIFTPRHAGKDGTPVVLAESNGQPLWYCSRFVRDEYVRQKRGQSTRFDEDNQPPKGKPKSQPNNTPKVGIGDDFGERQGDGSTSTSTSPSSNELSNSVEDCNLAKDQELKKTHTQIQVGLIVKALTGIGMMPFNPTLERFTALIEAGATVDEFVYTALEQKGSPDKFNIKYLLGTMTKRRQALAEAKPLHKGAMPTTQSSYQQGIASAAKSIFTDENTGHLQPNLKLVEVEDEPRAIAG